MKLIRFFGSVVLLVVALLFIVPLFVKEDYRLERSVLVAKSPEVLYGLVTSFPNWKRWSPWAEMDPGTVYQYSETSSAVGSWMTWHGAQLGSGRITILNLEPNRSIRSRLEFQEPQKMEGFDVWYFDKQPDGLTKVSWIYEAKTKYPFERLFSLFLDKLLVPQYEKGLKNLKAAAEYP